MEKKRYRTKTVKIGKLAVGSQYPVRVKAMLKSRLWEGDKFIKEAKKLEDEGAEAIRLAVKDDKDAQAAGVLKRYITVPLAADVHFHYRTALAAIEKGFDCVRINPLNMRKRSEIAQVARLAKKYKISIRVGVNSGGFRGGFSSGLGHARLMVKEAAGCLKILESQGFFDIMVSLKGSDVGTTVLANSLFRKSFDYPLHLGVTASGGFMDGFAKSCVALDRLFSQGIGDIVRVSLTAPSYLEVRAAKSILQATGVRTFGPQIISCPTCSRCQVDLIGLVEKFERELKNSGITRPLKIALMGCVVNGPGEAAAADVGAAFGKKKAVIFKKNKILGFSTEKNILKDLLREVKRTYGC